MAGVGHGRKHADDAIGIGALADEPSLLILDDLQWFDATSLALCHYLLRAAVADGGRILVVAAGRPSTRLREFELGAERLGLELEVARLGPLDRGSGLELIRHLGKEPDERGLVVVGRLVAHLATLRQMSLSVAGMLQAGQNPNLEAALVKDVGTTFEQEIPEAVHALLDLEPTTTSGSDLQQVLGYLVQRAPSFSLRGGTREVLRGIIARGLGLR